MVNEDRDPAKGSNPHSNGVYFSLINTPWNNMPNRINKNGKINHNIS